MNRLFGKALALVKVAATIAAVSGVLTSAALAGKAVSHAYDVAYNGANAVVRPGQAPTAHTHVQRYAQSVPSAVPSVAVERGVARGDNDEGSRERREQRRERRLGAALQELKAARSYARMNAYGLNDGDFERVERAARELEDATR